MNKQAKKLIQNELTGVDKVIAHKDGTLTCKRSYFFTHGMTAQKFGEKVEQFLTEKGFDVEVETENHWNAWPRDSWFQVKVVFK